MLVCKRVRYSGRVQGVGFRQTALSIAAGHVIVGYVRNLAQGDVEMVVQGEEDAISSPTRAAAFAEQTGGGLIVLEGSGHAPHIRDPVKVNLLIREFLESLR